MLYTSPKWWIVINKYILCTGLYTATLIIVEGILEHPQGFKQHFSKPLAYIAFILCTKHAQ